MKYISIDGINLDYYSEIITSFNDNNTVHHMGDQNYSIMSRTPAEDYSYLNNAGSQKFDMQLNTVKKVYPDGFTKLTILDKPLNLYNIYNRDSYTGEIISKVKCPCSIESLTTCIRCKYNPLNKIEKERTDNIRRAAQGVFDIAILNDWQWFYTFTFDKLKADRFEYSNCFELIQKYLQAAGRKNIKYLCVPDLHRSGAWHFHVLTDISLPSFDSGTFIVHGSKKPLKKNTISKMIKNKIISSKDIYQEVKNVSDWEYGFSTGIRIYKQGIVLSSYIVGHMTVQISPDKKHKNMNKSEISFLKNQLKQIEGRHRYISSKGLNREPDIFYFYQDYESSFGVEYKTDHGRVKFLNTYEAFEIDENVYLFDPDDNDVKRHWKKKTNKISLLYYKKII